MKRSHKVRPRPGAGPAAADNGQTFAVDTAVSCPWDAAVAPLADVGHSVLRGLLTPAQCTELASFYDDPSRFRSRVMMARHGFGRGQYQYFREPLPILVGEVRARMYERLAPVANQWYASLGLSGDFPAYLEDFRARCRAAGQSRPTPLLLKYGPGDYNRLHRDVYGPTLFPIQLTVLLSRPGVDFTGGEFVLTEQSPRMQSRAHVVPLSLGDGVLFPVSVRPEQGPRRAHQVQVRHGVSTIHTGQRFSLGVIFHDAA